MQNDKTQSARRKRNLGRDIYELLGSMRFAVSLLTFIAIATIIGTVLEQNQTEISYIDKFGTYWYFVFSKFDVAEIYNTWWFLLIMGFLVVSTTVCLIRNTPKMIKDMRTFREYVRQSSLRAFPHKIDIESDLNQEEGVSLGRSWLKHHGYSFKEKVDGDTVLLAAKKGSSNRLGFIFAHMAIVVILYWWSAR
ncbi:cytochrome c biogenesis protein ResB [Oligella ureolytica]